jgi:hypothetical protein
MIVSPVVTNYVIDVYLLQMLVCSTTRRREPSTRGALLSICHGSVAHSGR